MTRNKYGSRRFSTQSGSFASKLEAAVYGILRFREKAKEIEIISCQKHVYLTEARICYIPDFYCRNAETGIEFYVEAKGFETPEWKIKLRLWEHYGPGPLELWRGSWHRPFLEKTVLPTRK